MNISINNQVIDHDLAMSVQPAPRKGTALPAFAEREHSETSIAGMISDEAAKAADKLGQLRNGYAHARGKDAPKDAIKAIKLLHVLVEDTVSVFKDFEIKEGAFVRKGKPPKVVE